jgi:hypothetical protein
MRKWIIIWASWCLFSCATKQEKPNPQDDIETAQAFLQALNTGNYEWSKDFMVQNAGNDSLLKTQMNIFENKNSIQKKDISESSIVIHNREEITPTQVIITYSTSINKTIHKLRLMNTSGKWLVDFSYTFNGNL